MTSLIAHFLFLLPIRRLSQIAVGINLHFACFFKCELVSLLQNFVHVNYVAQTIILNLIICGETPRTKTDPRECDIGLRMCRWSPYELTLIFIVVVIVVVLNHDGVARSRPGSWDGLPFYYGLTNWLCKHSQAKSSKPTFHDMSIGDGHGHRQERNGEFCITFGPKWYEDCWQIGYRCIINNVLAGSKHRID